MSLLVVLSAGSLERLEDLWDLVLVHDRQLAVTHTITVHDDSLWQAVVHLVELLKRSCTQFTIDLNAFLKLD